MIYLGFSLGNLWFRKFGVIKEWHFDTPFKNKFIECGVYKSKNIIGATFSFYPHQSHGGLMFGVEFLGVNFDFNFIDKRHWNEDLNKWESYE